jgi:hypothetical protein
MVMAESDLEQILGLMDRLEAADKMKLLFHVHDAVAAQPLEDWGALLRLRDQSLHGRRKTDQVDPAEQDLVTILGRYLSSLESLEDCERLLMPIVTSYEMGHGKACLDQAMLAVTIHTNDDAAMKEIKLSFETYYELDRFIRKIQKTGAALAITARSLFIVAFTLFDSLVSDLMRLVLSTRPEILEASERTLTLKDILSFGSIDSVRRQYIEKEVEALLRESYAEQFNRMESRFGMKLRQDLSIWPEFIEMGQRRNLFVHCDGRVSRQYLTVCEQHQVSWSEQGMPEEGTQIQLSRSYFLRAIAVLHEMGLKLGQVLYRKHFPGSSPWRIASSTITFTTCYSMNAGSLLK